jgi:hypothetical protein
MESSEKNQALFSQLIMMLHGGAMQHMGKLKNPLTDKIERDLMQAQFSIDMLDMIQEKTRGNLSSEEERFLQSLLQELKLNYVDEINKDQQNQPEQEARTKSTQ